MTTTPTEACDGVLAPIGCPNCHTPDGAYPMRIIETVDDPRQPETWRRAVLTCGHCDHTALLEITLLNLGEPR